MRIGVNLSIKLQLEVIDIVAYLYSISLLKICFFKLLNKVLNIQFRKRLEKYSSSQVRPKIANLYLDQNRIFVYSYCVQLLDRERVVERDKRGLKVNLRAYIRYLVRYVTSNIYHIQILILNQIITTRNVTFDKRLFYQGEKT